MADASELLEHEPLLMQLERARALGFLGPGPVTDHIEHAAGFLRALTDVVGTVVDLGSGGGVPGLIIGVARVDLALVLVEAAAKRCRFLAEAVAVLDLPARVVEGRAEVVGHGELRGRADAVVARSFGSPAVTAECAAPLLRTGGALVVSEPPIQTGPRWPVVGLAKLGMALGPRSAGSPVVQIVHQTSPCPPDFPRRDGLPAKRPVF